MPASPFNCSHYYREQINQVTSFLDADPLYGNKDSLIFKLRAHFGGRLKSKQFNKGSFEYAPYKDNYNCEKRGLMCFPETGDNRNENSVYLTLIVGLFLNEHNRIANELQENNPFCDDETLFQNAKKILIAEYQEIIYKELLTVIIGYKKTREAKLLTFDYGLYN